MSTSDDAYDWKASTRQRGPATRTSRWNWAAYGVLLFVYACVMGNLPVIAIPEAAVDDGLYVRGAINILKGDWLGPYDNLTLSKGPFYSLWIAVNSYTGLPILFSQGLLYGLGCLALARTAGIWLRSELATFGLFVFLLLSPIPVSEGQLRIMREGIYTPMTMLIVAGCIGWVRLKWQPTFKRALLAIGLGVLLGSFWATREESIIIVVTLVAALLAVLHLAFTETNRVPSLVREIVLSASTGLVAIGVYHEFGQMNREYYGVADIVEFKQSEFVSAYSALARIRHSQPMHYVIVPREALDRAYGVSPAAAELQAYFKNPGYVEAGCAAYEVVPCDGEVHGGWFMWALRDAVATSGHYTTAIEARRFYAALAEQVNGACEANRIQCDARRDSMVPHFSWADVRKTVKRAGQTLWYMATLQAAEPGNWGKPRSCHVDDCGGGSLYRDFLDMTNTTLYDHPTWLPGFAAAGERKLDSANTRAQERSVLISGKLNSIATVYRQALPALCIIAAVCYLLSLAIAGVRRSLEATTVLSSFALITLLVRVILMAFLDAVAGLPSVNTLYLSPAFPFLLMFCFLSIASAVFHLRQYGFRLGSSRKQPA